MNTCIFMMLCFFLTEIWGGAILKGCWLVFGRVLICLHTGNFLEITC